MIPIEVSLRFERLEQRLLEELRLRLTNGEITERGLARRIGVSQPHMHNIFKGVRALSPSIADLILEELGLSVLDLVKTPELWGALSSRAPKEPTGPHVPLVSGRLSPRSPFPDLGGSQNWITLPANALRRVKRPVLVQVETDLPIEGNFPSPEVALLDIDESQRLTWEPWAWYAIRIDGVGLVRQVRREGDRLILLGQHPLFEDVTHSEIQIRDTTTLQYVRARVVWIGPDPRRNYFGRRPAASS